jgi:hypothetical protein
MLSVVVSKLKIIKRGVHEVAKSNRTFTLDSLDQPSLKLCRWWTHCLERAIHKNKEAQANRSLRLSSLD